jgi:predicted kinase
MTEATYRTLLDRALTGLEMGETVVLDASWRTAAMRRQAADVARRTSADLIELQCVADDATVARRLQQRRSDPFCTSEAGELIADRSSGHQGQPVSCVHDVRGGSIG